MKAIIVDDEKRARVLIRSIFEDHFSDIQIVADCPDLPSAVKSIKKHSPDLVLLDIEMPGFSGLQLLDFFNEDEINFSIIFITAYNEFAIQAFQLSAIDYILKPINITQLSEALDRFRKQRLKQAQLLEILKSNLESESDRKIAIPNRDSITYINAKDVIYVKADGSYSVFHTKDGQKYTLSRNLKFVEQMISNISFLKRCQKSYIVNTNEIKADNHAQGTLLLSSGVEIPATLI
jgi:two-component system LytT family response regulator